MSGNVVRDALGVVRAMPRGSGKRQAWAAAHALAWHVDASGAATVGLERLTAETGLSPKTLRAGFAALEALGLLERDRLAKKPGSDEWETRTYRFRGGQNDSLERR